MPRGGARPGAGRKRKDPELKRLAGTLRADRDQVPAMTDGATAPMIAPFHLSDLAQLLFRDVAGLLEKQGRARPEYAQHVALLALRLEQVQRWQAVLEIEGDTFSSKSVKTIARKDKEPEIIVSMMVRARPEVAMLADAMRQAQSLISELMLNPSAALRLADGHKKPKGAFDDF